MRAARGVPVTVKMRVGVDEDHITYLDAGRAAVEEGVAAVALHARTAAQYYSGTADWDAISRLRDALPAQVPVLGNGDIWSAEDAVAMVTKTGCDGVVVGRGCLGRPWLFADLTAAFDGRPERVRPDLATVAQTLRQHTELLAEHYGEQERACRDIRKHIAWYFKGYPVGNRISTGLATVPTLERMDELLAELDLTMAYPGEPAEGPRGRTASAKRVALPDGWLDSRELTGASLETIREAELSVSGG